MHTTPLTRALMAPYFLDAWLAATGGAPTREAAELLLALLYNETANGASLQNSNWGNLSHNPATGGDYWRPPWFDAEQIALIADPAKRARMEALHAQMLAHKAPEAFKAFASHEDGAANFVRFVLRPKMRPLIDAANSGDAVAFAHAVHSTAYCPDEACRNAGPTYDRIRSEMRAAAILPTSLPAPAPSTLSPKRSGAGQAVATMLVAGLGGWLLWKRYKRGGR
jgi:hypothetical protein